MSAGLAVLALASCNRVLGLEDDYYIASAASGGAGAGGETSPGAGTGGVSGGAPSVGGSSGGSGMSSEAGAAGESLVFAMPAGKLAFERFTTYAKGDSEMFVVTFPGGSISPELGQAYGLCSLFNGMFSPDGRYLVVGAVPATVCPTVGLDRNELEIYVLDLETPTPLGRQRVTDNAVPDEDPQFARDGRSILFKHAGHLARWVLGSAPFNETCTDTAGSYCFKHTGGTQQSKPAIDGKGTVCYESSISQTDPNGDILCFDLSSGLAGKDITLGDNVTLQVSHPNIYDSRPLFGGVDDSLLYFTRWSSSAASHVEQIWRKDLKNINIAEEHAAFCVDADGGCEAAYSLGDAELVVFASSASSLGKRDLFVAKFHEKGSISLNLLVPETVLVNTEKDESAPAYWRAP